MRCLEKLYIGSNLIKSIEELNSLTNLPLKDVVFRGNPFLLQSPNNYEHPQERPTSEYIPEILKKIPTATCIDGEEL